MLKRRLLPAAVVTGLALLMAAPGVRAITASGSQNPALTVTLTVTPDQVNPGSSATGTGYITNNSTTRQRLTVRGSITFPDGRSFNKDRVISIAPGKTLSLSRSIAIDRRQSRGYYRVTVFATTSAGTSSASLKIQVK